MNEPDDALMWMSVIICLAIIGLFLINVIIWTNKLLEVLGLPFIH